MSYVDETASVGEKITLQMKPLFFYLLKSNNRFRDKKKLINYTKHLNYFLSFIDKEVEIMRKKDISWY